jgi:hypothetical protein
MFMHCASAIIPGWRTKVLCHAALEEGEVVKESLRYIMICLLECFSMNYSLQNIHDLDVSLGP